MSKQPNRTPSPSNPKKRHAAIPLTPRINLVNFSLISDGYGNVQVASPRALFQETTPKRRKRRLSNASMFVEESDSNTSGYRKNLSTIFEECTEYNKENYDIADTDLLAVQNENDQQIQPIARPKEKVSSAKGKKKNCCFYCKKTVTQLPRHLETVHKDETEVRQIHILPKGCEERRTLLESLRKKGNFEYNTNSKLSDGKIIACRKVRDSINCVACCPECKGYFSKSSIRKHYKNCSKTISYGDRSLLSRSRRLTNNIHELASSPLKNIIFPILRDDNITKVIKYDSLVIIFANKLCQKYRSQHHGNMIRARLRLIGRFLLEIKSLDSSINDITDVLVPEKYDLIIKTVNRVAKLNTDSRKYQTPSVAFELGILLKKLANTLITESIKLQNKVAKKNAEEFLAIMKEDYGIAVNRTVLDNQLVNKRQQKVSLPSMNDIKLLSKYLASQRQIYYTKLNEGFEYGSWIKLSSCVLTSIQVFNRRRAGEIERALISDLNSVHCIEEQFDNELFNTLSGTGKEAARNFVRFVICGKLGRTVTVLLSTFIYECIKLLLKYRTNANISPQNQYIFATPGGKNKHLSACKLLREFAEVCGASNPGTLRGTLLRKHIATRSSLLNFNDTEITDLADYMGHSEKIHKNIYRQPLAEREILIMSRLLQHAQGDNDDDPIFKNIENDGDEMEIDRQTNTVNLAGEMEIEENDSGSDIDYIETPRETSIQTKFKSKVKRNNTGRRKWTTEENAAMLECFKSNIQNRALPSKSQCEQAVVHFPILSLRTVMQLKLWVSNYLKKSTAS